MKTLYFATTNKDKLQIAQTVCRDTGITIIATDLEIDEIQGENPELIVKDKVQRAFEQLGKPVIVSDDSWDIPALNGFPGAYMKSINHWFTPNDFLRLMDDIQDRRVYIHQYLAYTDGNIIKVFTNSIPGTVLHKARGVSQKSPNMTIITLDSDNGKTLAEVYAEGANAIEERYKNRPDAWHEFIEWYTSTEL